MAITQIQTPCFLREVISAVKLTLRVALDLTENHVVEIQEDNIDGLTKIKASNVDDIVVVADGGGTTPDHNGSGRLSQPFLLTCVVRLFTRRHTDINNSNQNWNTRHWQNRIRVLSAFQDRFLYDEAPDLPERGSVASGRQLSAWPMEAQVDNSAAEKKQIDHSFGETRIKIKIPFNLALE